MRSAHAPLWSRRAEWFGTAPASVPRRRASAARIVAERRSLRDSWVRSGMLSQRPTKRRPTKLQAPSNAGGRRAMPGLMENRSQGPLVEAGSEQRGFYLPSLLRLSEPLHESPQCPGESCSAATRTTVRQGFGIVSGLEVVNREARACVLGCVRHQERQEEAQRCRPARRSQLAMQAAKLSLSRLLA